MARKPYLVNGQRTCRKCGGTRFNAWNICYKCANDRNKAWYKANQQKVLVLHKAWKKANPEKVRAYDKAYYKANREKLRVTKKARYEANRDRAARDAFLPEGLSERMNGLMTGQELRAARKALGLNQTQLAAFAGTMKQGEISRAERRNTISPATTARIKAALAMARRAATRKAKALIVDA